MQHLTHNIYDALTLYASDESQWITEDTRHPGTFCIRTAGDSPGGQYWQCVCPEELAARRDDLEDEQIRQDEERQRAQQAWDDAEAERLWLERG